MNDHRMGIRLRRSMTAHQRCCDSALVDRWNILLVS